MKLGVCVEGTSHQFFSTLAKCMECDSSCVTCDGPEKINCKCCVNGLGLKGGQCVKCDST